MPVIPALRSQRQKNVEFKASLRYIARSCQKKKERKEEKKKERKKEKKRKKEKQVLYIGRPFSAYIPCYELNALPPKYIH
jgi:hypothetical protein